MKDVYAGLYLAALATTRMELGTGVTNPITRHPTVTANALDDVRSSASTQARLIADFAEVPAGLERFRDELAQAKADYDYSQHLSTHADLQSAVSDELTRALAVAGTPAECSARVAALLETGLGGCL